MSTHVRLVLPSDPAFAIVARTTAASLGARAGAGIDAVEDLRIVASELFALLAVASDPTSPDDDRPNAAPGITMDFSLDGPEITVSASTVAGARSLPDPDTFSWTILDGVLEGLVATVDEGQGHRRLVLSGRLRLHIPA